MLMKTVQILWLTWIFDKVSHGKLVRKVTIHEIQGKLETLIPNRLGNKRKRVMVERQFVIVNL